MAAEYPLHLAAWTRSSSSTWFGRFTSVVKGWSVGSSWLVGGSTRDSELGRSVGSGGWRGGVCHRWLRWICGVFCVECLVARCVDLVFPDGRAEGLERGYRPVLYSSMSMLYRCIHRCICMRSFPTSRPTAATFPWWVSSSSRSSSSDGAGRRALGSC